MLQEDASNENEAPGPRILWPEDLLQRHRLSEDSAHFLRVVGLPEYLPGMTLEFGIFDSEGPDLIIGEDDGFPVYVDYASGVVFYAADWEADGSCLVNSSVQQLAHFIQRVVFDPPSDEDDGETWAASLLEELKTVDAAALQPAGSCLWPALIERFQLNIA